ncbi:MAG: nitroreductase family protein [Acidimicrobiia bacterium]|nr:nitroreductase family protein [Acidimicrobiia bacterium]
MDTDNPISPINPADPASGPAVAADGDIDTTSVDRALMTTRAVRRRLDLDRPVDRQILLDCIDIAEQAPSGGNQGSRRWIIIEDQATKDRLAEIYMECAGRWMIETHQRLEGRGHPQEKVMASAAHLARHLAEVPAIVIPTIIGVHDGSGRPGLFDSVIQAVWSFCVALRARGLGSAWTTAILARQEDVADLLDIPDGMTQIVMLPVAWMKGTSVKLAPRLPAREITYFNRFSQTWESGPGDPPSIADGPGVVVETDIKAPPTTVWPFVTDINFGADHSTEFSGARWVAGPDSGDRADDADGAGGQGPGVGAKFIGSNVHEAIGQWEVTCFVDRYEPERSFGWVTSNPDNPGARWRFELQPIAGATRLRYRVILGPGPSGITAAIEQMPDKQARIISRRLGEHRTNMTAVVEAIKAAAEAARPGRPESTARAPLS